MTNEQREAIKICEHYKNILYACNYEKGPERTGQAIDTVLSLIKAQQEEISKYKTLYERALSDVVKTDKQIDLMAEIFYKRFKAELLLEYGFESKKEIKQYFERKVEDVKD